MIKRGKVKKKKEERVCLYLGLGLHMREKMKS
jgi:hypothetical protein